MLALEFVTYSLSSTVWNVHPLVEIGLHFYVELSNAIAKVFTFLKTRIYICHPYTAYAVVLLHLTNLGTVLQ